MSTRCHIALYENTKQPLDKPTVLLYRHSDGYPEGEHGVVKVLKDFCAFFDERRGLGDTEYAGAWLMYYLIDNHVKDMQKYVKERGDAPYSTVPEDGRDCLGHGICKPGENHWDIAYYYRVNPTSIIVYQNSYDNDTGISSERSLKKIQTIRLRRKGKNA